MPLRHLVLIPFMLALVACTESEDPASEPLAVPNPTLEGPVTGGNGAPFIQSTSFNLADVGYRQTELFMSGTARAFTNVGELGEDGVWDAALSGSTADYKVRIVVYRPIDAQQFNGTVVVEWLNVSGGTARLELEGDPPAYVLDDVGNVRGGIRTPAVDVPLATLSGLGQTGGTFCRIFGTTIPFDTEALADLYPTHAAYVAAVNDATGSAVAAGFIRPADAELIKQAAEEADV